MGGKACEVQEWTLGKGSGPRGPLRNGTEREAGEGMRQHQGPLSELDPAWTYGRTVTSYRGQPFAFTLVWVHVGSAYKLPKPSWCCPRELLGAVPCPLWWLL